MSKYGAEPSVFPIFDVSEPVSMLDARIPTGEFARPRPYVIIDANFTPENVAAPAIVISRDPEHRHSAVDDIGESAQNSERRTRNDRAPLEPELEQVAVDDNRSGAAFEMAEKNEQTPLDLAGRSA